MFYFVIYFDLKTKWHRKCSCLSLISRLIKQTESIWSNMSHIIPMAFKNKVH